LPVAAIIRLTAAHGLHLLSPELIAAAGDLLFPRAPTAASGRFT